MVFALLEDILQMKMTKVETPPVKTHEHYNQAEVRINKAAA